MATTEPAGGKLRVAAIGDLHVMEDSVAPYRDLFIEISNNADVLVLCGDLTNFGKTSEMEPLLNALVRLRLPIVAVLGNHDYESGQEGELMKMMTDEGIKVLDGTAYERDGVGFAGTKGFIGGFGRGMLTAFGEPEVKRIVQSAIDETLKLERAMSQLRTEKRVVVVHYAPVVDTVKGEAPEIFPYLGTSRLGEVVDRHGANLVIHGHAHHGAREGKTVGGIPVYNVALHLLQTMDPPAAYRIFDV
jgi:Icc-related predicted phosphoesterase